MERREGEIEEEREKRRMNGCTLSLQKPTCKQSLCPQEVYQTKEPVL